MRATAKCCVPFLLFFIVVFGVYCTQPSTRFWWKKGELSLCVLERVTRVGEGIDWNSMKRITTSCVGCPLVRHACIHPPIYMYDVGLYRQIHAAKLRSTPTRTTRSLTLRLIDWTCGAGCKSAGEPMDRNCSFVMQISDAVNPDCVANAPHARTDGRTDGRTSHWAAWVVGQSTCRHWPPSGSVRHQASRGCTVIPQFYDYATWLSHILKIYYIK